MEKDTYAAARVFVFPTQAKPFLVWKYLQVHITVYTSIHQASNLGQVLY